LIPIALALWLFDYCRGRPGGCTHVPTAISVSDRCWLRGRVRCVRYGSARLGQARRFAGRFCSRPLHAYAASPAAVSSAFVGQYAGSSSSTMITNGNLFDACMNSQGWALQKPPPKDQQAATEEGSKAAFEALKNDLRQLCAAKPAALSQQDVLLFGRHDAGTNGRQVSNCAVRESRT
jgi:hypothetical protein